MQSNIKIAIKFILFVLLLLSPIWLCRLGLFYLVDDLSIESPLNYWHFTTRFDLKTIAIWYSPFYLLLGIAYFIKSTSWKNICKSVFMLLYAGLFVFGSIAVLYYPISKSIIGVELFQILRGQDVTIVTCYLLDYWYAIAIALALFIVVFHFYDRLVVSIVGRKSIVLRIISLCLIVFLARGGLALKPLNILDGYAHLSDNETVTAITPAYVLLESYGKNSIEYISYFSETELNASLAEDVHSQDSQSSTSRNICTIILESFGAEYTKLNRSGRPSYTPFLDSLMDVSLNYTNAYANGLRSMDAVGSIYCLLYTSPSPRD